MFKLLETLCGKINFVINDNSQAVLEINHNSVFYHENKSYILDTDRSSDTELFWKNGYANFSLSAALSDGFRQIYLSGYYHDGFSTSPIRMTDNYILDRENYDRICSVFANILETRLDEIKTSSQMRKVLVKTGISVAIGTVAYTTAGLGLGVLGLLAVPLFTVNKPVQQVQNRDIVIKIMERNQGKTIKQLYNLVSRN